MLRVVMVVLMDGSRVAMLHPRLTCGGLPLCVAMIRHPFAACSHGGVKKARFIGRFDQDKPHHVTMELQGAPPSCNSPSVYMNEYVILRKVLSTRLRFEVGVGNADAPN